MNSFKKYYDNIIKYHIFEKFGYHNSFSNSDIKSLIISGNLHNFKDKNSILTSLYGLELFSHQKPLLVKSKKAVAFFNLKKDTIIGYKITLRKDKAMFLLFKLPQIGFCRMIDVDKVQLKKNQNPKNISFGFKNIFVFPEMDHQYNIFKEGQGSNINVAFDNSTLGLYVLSHLQYL